MNDKTMQQVYLLAQEHSGLKVGDWVRVIRRAERNEAGWNNGWIQDMNVTIGKIGRVESFSNFGVFVYFGNPIISTWNFPYFVLEKVEKAAHEFKTFDRVLVRDIDTHLWRADFFSYFNSGAEFPYICIGGRMAQCIPYEGNEHLCGTTNKPVE